MIVLFCVASAVYKAQLPTRTELQIKDTFFFLDVKSESVTFHRLVITTCVVIDFDNSHARNLWEENSRRHLSQISLTVNIASGLAHSYIFCVLGIKSEMLTARL